jgi:hypothetical protein
VSWARRSRTSRRPTGCRQPRSVAGEHRLGLTFGRPRVVRAPRCRLLGPGFDQDVAAVVQRHPRGIIEDELALRASFEEPEPPGLRGACAELSNLLDDLALGVINGDRTVRLEAIGDRPGDECGSRRSRWRSTAGDRTRCLVPILLPNPPYGPYSTRPKRRIARGGVEFKAMELGGVEPPTSWVRSRLRSRDDL